METTPTVTDLLREVQETNRLLRALVSQKTVSPGLAVDDSRSLGMASLETHSPPLSPSPPEPSLVRAKTRQLVQDLAHAVFGSADRENLERFRDMTGSSVSSRQLNSGRQFEFWEFLPPFILSPFQQGEEALD
jgi:hypothetical protein